MRVGSQEPKELRYPQRVTLTALQISVTVEVVYVAKELVLECDVEDSESEVKGRLRDSLKEKTERRLSLIRRKAFQR